MDLKIGKRYFKDGREMPADYTVEAMPELTELLDRVYSRVQNQHSEQIGNNKDTQKSSA